MVPRGDPAPLRWLIGVELARYRNLAKLSLAEASRHTTMSKAKLGHLETGRQQQAPDDIARLLAAYGAEQRDIDRLTSLTGRADEATWWAPWAQVVPDWLKTFVGLEGLAESEFTFEPIIIPGLLQTEQYAAAVTAGTPRVRATMVSGSSGSGWPAPGGCRTRTVRCGCTPCSPRGRCGWRWEIRSCGGRSCGTC